MKLNTFFAFATTAISSTLAAPHALQAEAYFLRVNAPQEPYHHRHLVLLPVSQRLGLENFTVHPSTPPVTFTPVRLPSGNFALRGTYAGDDLTETPYISALISKDGTIPITLGVVFAPAPTKEAVEREPEACPPEYECKADGWTGVDRGVLRFGAEEGTFEPVKEAPEGWIMYWKVPEDGKVFHPAKLEVVPVKASRGYEWRGL